MAESRKCPACDLPILNTAKYCTECGKKLNKSRRVKGFLLILVLVFFGGAWLVSKTTPDSPVPVVTADQKKAAAEIQKLLMESGLVMEYKGEGKIQIVYVKRPLWDINSFEKKKEVLKTLSQSNEVQGFTPWIEIRDFTSGEVYAAVKPPLTFEVYK